jgi:hypothetical protein
VTNLNNFFVILCYKIKNRSDFLMMKNHRQVDAHKVLTQAGIIGATNFLFKLQWNTAKANYGIEQNSNGYFALFNQKSLAFNNQINWNFFVDGQRIFLVNNQILFTTEEWKILSKWRFCYGNCHW